MCGVLAISLPGLLGRLSGGPDSYCMRLLQVRAPQIKRNATHRNHPRTHGNQSINQSINPSAIRGAAMKSSSLLNPQLLLLLLLFAPPARRAAASAVRADPALFFTGETYLAWLSDVSLSNKYAKSYFLAAPSASANANNNNSSGAPPSANANGVGLFWTIRGETQTIALAAVARATGWVGFGIAEAGGMRGADMVVFEAATGAAFDAHVLDDVAAGPRRDDCQDWRLTNSIVVVADDDDSDGPLIIFEVERALRTGDSFDRAFVDDRDPLVPATRVIAAWGSDSGGTVAYHGNNRARASIRFFADADAVDDQLAFQSAMAREAQGSFEFRAVDYPIQRNRVTDYEHFCFSNADLIAMGLPEGGSLHMIGMEPVIDEDARPHVHHFILYGSTETNNDNSGSCQRMQATEMITGWAPGEGSFAYPENVGSPLGVGGYQSLLLEIHYDNADGIEGVFDSSGIRAYYTSNKRQYDLGVLQLGDPLVRMRGPVVSDGAEFAQHTFDCPAQCSSLFATQPLTVIYESMHMHATGERMYNEQIRNGQVIRTGAVDFFDFDQQGSQAVQQQPFQILPGDAFRTRCYFNGKDDSVEWGAGSHEEMCISFLSYYPRQTFFGTVPFVCGKDIAFDNFDACEASHNTESIGSVTELERSFGGPDGQCAMPLNAMTSLSPTADPTTAKPTPAPISRPTNSPTVDLTTTAPSITTSTAPSLRRTTNEPTTESPTGKATPAPSDAPSSLSPPAQPSASNLDSALAPSPTIPFQDTSSALDSSFSAPSKSTTVMFSALVATVVLALTS